MNEPRKLVVSIDDQTLRLIEGGSCLREYPVSTAIKGMGFVKDSYRTPVGNFRICEKIGAGQPVGTIFKARVPVGQWQQGESPDDDLVLTRILRLDGIDAANANTLERCVYIHGTNREDLISKPAGHGCVRLRNADMVELFEVVAENDLLEIQPATRRRGKLMFISFESLIGPCDGIVEMARLRGETVHHKVREIIAARDDGRISSGDAFLRSMEFIKPDRELCEAAAAVCSAILPPWVTEFTSAVKAGGWLPVLISQCPLPIVSSIARKLGMHCEAPLLKFQTDGSCADPGCGYPIIGNFEQSGVISDWLAAFLPEKVAVAGDFAMDDGIKSIVDIIIDPGLICNQGNEKLAVFAGNSLRAKSRFDHI